MPLSYVGASQRYMAKAFCVACGRHCDIFQIDNGNALRYSLKSFMCRAFMSRIIYFLFFVVLIIYFPAEVKCGESLSITANLGKIDENSISDYINKAEESLGAGDYKMALIKTVDAIRSSVELHRRDLEIRALYIKGKILGKQGYLLDAQHAMKEVLNWYKNLTELFMQIEVYGELAKLSTDIDLDASESYLKEAERIAQDIKDESLYKKATAWLHYSYIFLNMAEKDIRQLSHHADAAIRLYREIGDQKREAEALLLSSTILLNQGRYEIFRDNLERAQSIYRLLGDISGESKTIVLKGIYYHRLGEYSKAELAFNQSFSFQQQLRNKAQEVKVYSLLGNLYYGINSYDKAKDFWEKALALSVEIGDIGQEIWIKQSLAGLYAMKDLDKAIDMYRKILEQAEKTSNKATKIDVLWNLGDLLNNQGKHQDALRYINEALKIAESAHRRYDVTKVLMSLVSLYSRIGEYEKALSAASRYIENLNDYEMLWLLPNAYAQRAGIYERLYRHEDALKDYREGIDRARKISDYITEASLWSSMATVYTRSGNKAQAFESLFEAEKILVKYGENYELLAVVYTNMGELLMEVERYDDAIACFTESLRLYEEMGREDRAADMAYITGHYYFLMEHPYSAIMFHHKAISYFEKNGLWLDMSKAYADMSSFYNSLGRKEESIQYLAKGIDAFEKTRALITVAELKTPLYGKFSELYDTMIHERLVRQEVKEAFDYLERAKSRSFLDMLGNEKIKPKTADEKLVQEERSLRSNIAELHKMRKDEELKAAYNQYEILLQRIKVEDPSYASLVSVNPLTAEEIRKFLDKDMAIIEYHVVGHRSQETMKKGGVWNINIFVLGKEDIHAVRLFGLSDLVKPAVTRGKMVDTVYLPQSEMDGLENQIVELYEILRGSKPQISKRWEGILRSFHKLLIEPVAPYIADKNCLCIVPYGILHHVPFPALKSDNGYLIEGYRLSFAPSASILKFSLENEEKAGKDKVIFADVHSLYFAEKEAREIVNLYPDTKLYLGNQVSIEKVRNLRGRFRFVHFATHGEFSIEAPLFSHLKLMPEGDRLEVREIFNLDLPASLITLSACETGLSKLTSGDELIGLSNAFIYAGASSLIVSLWKVDDKSTSELMRSFYENLGKTTKDEALRRAQLYMIKDKVYNIPYFWATFILVGNWK